MVDLHDRQQLHEAMELLYFGYRAFTDRADRILERHDLGRVHHRILYFIGRNPGISVGGLLATLAISKQALNAPLRRLVEMRLVASAPGEEDRRVRSLVLTAEGRTLEAELSGAQMAYLKTAFSRASSWDIQGWRKVMAELAGD